MKRNIYNKMDGKLIKRNRLYYWIRKFSMMEEMENCDQHIDFFLKEELDFSLWYDFAIDIYKLCQQYIKRKEYGLTLLIYMHIHLDVTKLTTNKKNLFKGIDEPPSILLHRGNNIKDVFVKDIVYSKELTCFTGLRAFLDKSNGYRKNEWDLFLF